MSDDGRQREDGTNEAQEATECTPLVVDAGGSSASSTSHLRRRRTSIVSFASTAISIPKPHKPSTIVNLFCVIILIGAASAGFQDIPMTRIYEDILCRQYYDSMRGRDKPIDEDMCKVEAVQSELAYLFAVIQSLNAGLSCLVALPWGIAADLIGRKPVFALALVGMSLSLVWIMGVAWFRDTVPVRLVWLSPLLYLCGGGNPALAAAVSSMCTDVVPESERSASFMRIHAASMVGNLISPALASAMMSSTGPWPVMLFSLCLTLTSAALVFMVPETLHHKQVVDEADAEPVTLKGRIAQGISQLKDSLSFLKSPTIILVLCTAFFELPLIICTYQFMSQFTSKRYHIPLAKTGYIQSAYGIAHVVVALVIIPFVSSLVTKPSMPGFLRITDEKRRDLVLTRWSYVASFVATVILGISPSLPGFVGGLAVMALGSGAPSFLKSIATLHVDPEHRSRLFSLIGLVDIASNMWTSPALAALFSLGMRLGGIWIGLPYLGISVTCVIMLTLMMFVQPTASPGEDEESSSDDGSGTGNED